MINPDNQITTPEASSSLESDKEDKAWQLLESIDIPDEIKQVKKWEERLDEGEYPDEIIKEINFVYDQRNKIANGELNEPLETVSLNEVSEGKKDEILKVVQEVMKRKENILGEGGTAQVYPSINYPEKYCFKIITNFEEYKNHNNISRERDIAEKVYNLNIPGVKIPETLYVGKNNQVHIMVMEVIKGKDLEKALIDGGLPESYDHEAFFESLQKFIKEMHKHGIHHRDIKMPNIMIEWETGKPCLIDFGKATDNVLGSEDPYFERNELTKTAHHWRNDLEGLKRISNNNLLKKFSNKN